MSQDDLSGLVEIFKTLKRWRDENALIEQVDCDYDSNDQTITVLH